VLIGEQLVKLSILISTFNRSQELETLLDDIVLQHKRLRSSDAQEVEVIIIDNNSFDDTKETIYKYLENTDLSVKFFNDNHYGLASARNLAIEKAQGDLLAFIHDDINLDDDWLREIFKIAQNCKEREIGVYGGRVIPLWQDELPKWLDLQGKYKVDQSVFHGHSFGDEEQFYPFNSCFGEAKFPTGTNVLVRKEIFENCGLFREDLGPCAQGGFGTYEDTEFFDYLATIKVPMLYVPQCIVFHPINKFHMTVKNIRRWYYKTAKAKYWTHYTDRMQRKTDALFAIKSKYKKWIPNFLLNTINHVPMYLYLKFFVLSMQWLFSNLSFNKEKTNSLSFKVSESIGEIEAASLLHEKQLKRKFSFKDKLISKGLIKQPHHQTEVHQQ
jgi:glycosyltransferase involved in cell wall biosynthesis